VEDKRNRIIEIASVLITQKGVENTSLADIAHDVGISKGTLYYYYPSKSELVLEVAKHHLNKITQGLINLAKEMTEIDRVEDILNGVFENIINDETQDRLHLYLVQEALTNNDELKKIFKNLYVEWRQIIQDGLNKVMKGKAENYEALSSVILTCLDGFIIQYLIGVQDIPIYNIANYLINRI
jgi:AcrR family transcriptional regulator